MQFGNSMHQEKIYQNYFEWKEEQSKMQFCKQDFGFIFAKICTSMVVQQRKQSLKVIQKVSILKHRTNLRISDASKCIDATLFTIWILYFCAFETFMNWFSNIFLTRLPRNSGFQTVCATRSSTTWTVGSDSHFKLRQYWLTRWFVFDRISRCLWWIRRST